MESFQVEPLNRLRGTFSIPGDKSITHRAYLMGGLASGVTTIRNANPGKDCDCSLRAMTRMGARVTLTGEDEIQLRGAGGALVEPDDVIDCGNSGTSMRLLSGIVAGVDGLVVMTGDDSLRSRPMRRITEPLELMGARFWSRDGGRAPLVVRGGSLRGINYELPVASAQVKSAVLLAGLSASGTTTVVEPLVSRDHTERMLERFGVGVAIEPLGEGGELGPRRVSIEGGSQLTGTEINVPGDPSAAAFFIVAALISPDAEVVVENVGINPTRRGIIDALIEMGGEIEVRGATDDGHFEPVATVVARSSRLRPLELGGERIPALIDELPIFAVAAAFAGGTTVVRDAAELRVKESDRIDLICRNLTACGVRVEEREDGFSIHGGPRPHGADTDGHGDHRIAMSMAILGLACEGRMTVRGAGGIPTSFPGFVEQLAQVGAVT
jgi:3-phosphoshikimate 1-carboxyvinyltransferase